MKKIIFKTKKLVRVNREVKDAWKIPGTDVMILKNIFADKNYEKIAVFDS
jgi:hypothetical protein